MIESVMAFDRMPVRDLMTPRSKIIWINAADAHDTVWQRIVVSAHSVFPVYEGRRDNVIGLVTVKAIYANLAAGVPVNVRDLATPALVVPESLSATALLEKFKALKLLTESGFALVRSSYFNTFLFLPIFIIIRFISRTLGLMQKIEFKESNPALNAILALVFSFEVKLLAWLSMPFGVSALAVAKK